LQATLFVLKLGLGTGRGALIGWMLAGGGYDAASPKPRTGHHQHHYRVLFTLVPAACYVLSAIIAKRYYSA